MDCVDQVACLRSESSRHPYQTTKHAMPPIQCHHPFHATRAPIPASNITATSSVNEVSGPSYLLASQETMPPCHPCRHVCFQHHHSLKCQWNMKYRDAYWFPESGCHPCRRALFWHHQRHHQTSVPLCRKLLVVLPSRVSVKREDRVSCLLPDRAAAHAAVGF